MGNQLITGNNMTHHYSDDRGTQIVLALLKAHGIHKVVTSPGTTNIALVGSMQIDPWFELYSSVDERSAAYIACGLAYESGEPVVITCTEATASRNYFPGLTEAHYRKLPVLAITGNHGTNNAGHLKSQVIDRSQVPVDTVIESVSVSKIHDKDDEWQAVIDVNKAILALTRNGGGPSHINLQFSCNTYETRELPTVRVIKRIQYGMKLPEMPKGKIAVFVGAHKQLSSKETSVIERFCESHNAAVFCDKTSAYTGKYRVDYALVSAQIEYDAPTNYPDLIIHIGEVSGETYTQNKLHSKSVWRINEDGELRDTFRALKYVFQMQEQDFFSSYIKEDAVEHTYYQSCINQIVSIKSQLPEIGFSNVWVAKTLSERMPENCVLHLGIYNSLRSWNFASFHPSIHTICNVGGFGIDGALSTAFGASLAHSDRLYFVALGDLAFFYDMNVLGNRDIKTNLRILVINNGKGTEFRKFDHPCRVFGDNADLYMAAAGHFGNKSESLIKSYVSSLGYKYLTASTKEDFLAVASEFTSDESFDKPIVLEVFTDSVEESKAVDAYRHIIKENGLIIKGKVKSMIKSLIK
ncbi:MAG: thiamine pyrophosphate-binding protein [Muribaculaceae bacterium]|nr:thiamine pyrophosphate-binding protein [Muribaculaceae bacterium]